MTVGSVFTGIGGFDEGFRRAGFDIAWMCEREVFCRKVLARHFPGVPCSDDVTTLTDAPAVDVLVGGFPCQDISVAGQRRGLSGARSGLFFEFVRLLRLLRPATCVIENVDGLLSNDLGSDFATVLAHLADVGYVGAWRVLDSQWFGVPQRRARVFFVGCARGLGRRAKAVLFESARGAWDSPARGEAGARVAATLRGRSSRPGVNEPGRGGEDDQNLIAFTLPSVHRGVGNGHNTNYIADPISAHEGKTYSHAGNNAGRLHNVIAPTLDTSLGHHRGSVGVGDFCVPVASSGERARALTASMHKRHDEDTDTLIASPITASAGHHGHSSPRGDGHDNLIAFDTTQLTSATNRSNPQAGDPCHSLAAGAHPPAIAGHGVRRLTPLECERLQGFPDGWTCICGDGHRGSRFCTCPDTPRYKALGNAVTVNVAEWIAGRLMTACVDSERRASR